MSKKNQSVSTVEVAAVASANPTENIINQKFDAMTLDSGIVVHGVSIAKRGEDKKALVDQFCSVTGRKSRILWSATTLKGTEIGLSTSAVKAAGASDKVMNKLYGIQYKIENPAYGQTAGKGKLTADEIRAALLEA